MNLPPFPEGFLPRSPEERLMLVQWGEQCRAMGLEADGAQYPDQRNRGLLQAAKQALAALDRHATQLPWGTPGYPVPTPGVDLLYEARSHLEPAIRREEEFRAAIDAARNAQHSTDGETE